MGVAVLLAAMYEVSKGNTLKGIGLVNKVSLKVLLSHSGNFQHSLFESR
jgi:hypothetical protein